MKLLVDMNLSPRWVQALVAAGFDAAHWSALGAATAPDTAIMAFAKSSEYIVLTNDLDFGAILAATHGSKPSVVQVRSENVNPDVMAGLAADALRQMEQELREGALLTIDSSRVRLRILPLRQTP